MTARPVVHLHRRQPMLGVCSTCRQRQKAEQAREEGSYDARRNRKYRRGLWATSSHTGVGAASPAPPDARDAVRFARGEMVKSNTDRRRNKKTARRSTWVAVTDQQRRDGTIRK